eukprot:6206883-Pleurochrysis_carterae.AAC.1
MPLTACFISCFHFRHRVSRCVLVRPPLCAQSTRDEAKSRGEARDEGDCDLGSTQQSCEGGDTAEAAGKAAHPAAEVTHGRGG